jgi:hypothetical protein
MKPETLYLILCDEVRTDPNNYHRINIFGLNTTVRSTASPPFPVVHSLLCALLVLTGGQGSGELVLRIFHGQTGRVIFRNPPHPLLTF